MQWRVVNGLDEVPAVLYFVLVFFLLTVTADGECLAPLLIFRGGGHLTISPTTLQRKKIFSELYTYMPVGSGVVYLTIVLTVHFNSTTAALSLMSKICFSLLF